MKDASRHRAPMRRLAKPETHQMLSSNGERLIIKYKYSADIENGLPKVYA